MQPRAPAATEHRPQHRQGIVVRRGRRRNLVGHVDPVQPGQTIIQRQPPLLGPLRLRNVNRRGRALGGDGFEVFARPGEGFVGFHIPHDREDGVVRGVVGLEEGGDVLDRCGVQILHRADDRVLVGRVVEREPVERFERPAIRLVVEAGAALFLHGMPLVVEVVLRNLQGAHAVGFQEQRKVELVRGERLVVVRPVVCDGRPEAGIVSGPFHRRHPVRRQTLTSMDRARTGRRTGLFVDRECRQPTPHALAKSRTWPRFGTGQIYTSVRAAVGEPNAHLAGRHDRKCATVSSLAHFRRRTIDLSLACGLLKTGCRPGTGG
ncbi:hypothetical protein BH24ACI4_BH24ACI4_22710 [soil metagenome]